jgi:hypothetical protein
VADAKTQQVGHQEIKDWRETPFTVLEVHPFSKTNEFNTLTRRHKEGHRMKMKRGCGCSRTAVKDENGETKGKKQQDEMGDRLSLNLHIAS